MDLERAKKLRDQIKASAAEVIRIMTAEQAWKAQKVVREAGKRRK
jgi:hypothetical protein